MPLVVDAAPTDFALLRLALIGNKDLKNKLTNDTSFLSWLFDLLEQQTAALAPGTCPSEELNTLVVILHVLVANLDLCSDQQVWFKRCVEPLVLVARHAGTVLPAHDFDDTLSESICVMLQLANLLPEFVAGIQCDWFWRLAVLYLVLADGDDRKAKRMLGAVLKTVPLCLLVGDVETTKIYGKVLLDLTLRILTAELARQHEKKYLTTLVVCASQLLNFFSDRKLHLPKLESTTVHRGLNTLLDRPASYLTHVAALNLLCFYLEEANQFEDLFPRIVELLNHNYHHAAANPLPKYVKLPASILSDLCMKYPAISVQLRNTNVDYKIIRELKSLFENTSLFMNLHKLKARLAKSTTLVDFTALRNSPLIQSAQLEMVLNYLLLLSVFTGSNEEFRRRVTSLDTSVERPGFLCLMIFELVDNFRFLMSQLMMAFRILPRKQESLSWFGRNIGVIFSLLGSPLYTHAFYLIRLLSRSVATLRTFFVDCNSIKGVFDDVEESAAPKSILELVAARHSRAPTVNRSGSFIASILAIVGGLEKMQQTMLFVGPEWLQLIRQDVCVSKVVLLGSIANLILDFSSFRHEIVHYTTFLEDLALLVRVRAEDHSETYEQLRVEQAVMQVLKNYLYNENEDNRKTVWEHFPLLMILTKALYGVSVPVSPDEELDKLLLSHKVLAFEVMRNLTAGSAYFSEVIKDSYEKFAKLRDAPQTWGAFLLTSVFSFGLGKDDPKDIEASKTMFAKNDEHVLKMLLNPEFKRLLVSINFLEDHRYTNIRVFKRSDFPGKDLLDLWKRLLLLSIPVEFEEKFCPDSALKLRLFNLLVEVKVSVDWILVNLTSKDEDFGFSMPDKFAFRLLDTVSTNPDELSSNLFSLLSINVEESEEESAESAAEDDDLMTPEQRALILHDHGFSHVLRVTLNEMAEPGPRSSGIQRFDALNTNDHYEKSKLAHQQIVLLVGGEKWSEGGERPGRRANQDSVLRHIETRPESEEEYDEDIDDYWVR